MKMNKEAINLQNAKTRVLTLAAVAVILVGALVITATNKTSPRQTIATTTGSTRVLGASTEAKDATITVNKIVTVSNDARSTYGMKRITVNVTIKNTSGKELLVSPGSQMTLVDKKGGAYVMTAGYNSGHVIGGPLASGQSFNGDIDFEIPLEATTTQFIYQADANSPASVINL